MRYLFAVVTLMLCAIFTVDVGAVSQLGHQALASPTFAADAVKLLATLGGLAVFGTVLGANSLTLADHAKRTDPSGGISKIVEMLSQSNPLLEDMVWREGNLPTGHRTTVRTGLPTVAWRLINAGVTPSKS
ncbi:MAG TPA: hypothetical protein VN755_07140, partial [Steroidobacteraceae bacterium]|nr:hypothetical protein [Steroidobacteraceae bacterium]